MPEFVLNLFEKSLEAMEPVMMVLEGFFSICFIFDFGKAASDALDDSPNRTKVCYFDFDCFRTVRLLIRAR